MTQISQKITFPLLTCYVNFLLRHFHVSLNIAKNFLKSIDDNNQMFLQEVNTFVKMSPF